MEFFCSFEVPAVPASECREIDSHRRVLGTRRFTAHTEFLEQLHGMARAPDATERTALSIGDCRHRSQDMAQPTVIEHPSVAGSIETAIRSMFPNHDGPDASVGMGHPLMNSRCGRVAKAWGERTSCSLCF